MDTQHELFYEYSSFLSKHLVGKVQKLSIDGGFGCPNCDGRLGRGGCAYCNNHTFTPGYCLPTDSIALQIQKGVEFFRHKYPEMKYLAYFQSHTNTYAPLDTLKRKYEEALQQDGIVGLVVGTRPDCVDNELLDYMGSLARHTFVMMEYGIESTEPIVLRAINRGHDFEQSRNAIERSAERGLHTAGHIILGLPYATRTQMLEEPNLISSLPLDVLKLHQLQIVKGTQLARQYLENPSKFGYLFSSPEDYADFAIDYIERLRPDIAVERFTSQSPSDLLIAPRWGMKNYQFVELLKKRLRTRQTWQGRLYNGPQE